MKPKLSEKDIQRQVLDYLAIKRLFHWRNNTGMIFSEYKGKKRAFKMGQVGSPDIFIVILGQIIGLEIKSPKGKQSENQIEWQKAFEKAGGKYHLIYSVEELQNIISVYETYVKT